MAMGIPQGLDDPEAAELFSYRFYLGALNALCAVKLGSPAEKMMRGRMEKAKAEWAKNLRALDR